VCHCVFANQILVDRLFKVLAFCSVNKTNLNDILYKTDDSYIVKLWCFRGVVAFVSGEAGLQLNISRS